MWVKVLAAAIVEVAYAVFTRTWLRQQLDGAYLELAITACRIVTIIIYWVLFQSTIQSRPKTLRSLKHPLLILGVILALAIPFLFQGWSPGGGFGTAVAFALTSIVVGLREELLYRAVLINLLQPRIGALGALLCSTTIFIIYHYGALPVTWLAITEVASMSFLLGLVYVHSGSLFTVAAIHAVYDAVWFFGPFISVPLQNQWRLFFLLPALGFVVLWRFMAQQGIQADAASPRRLT